jgi:putative ABC transport system ATP-binding protein
MDLDRRKLTSRPAGNGVANDIEQAAWLFEQLALDADAPADRARIARAHEETAMAWPGDPADRWWKWVVETSHSLGQRCKVIDCTFDQFLEIVREGGKIVVRVGGTDRWLAVSGNRGRKFHVMQPLVDDWQQWVTPGKLRSMLNADEQHAVIRCVVVQPEAVAHPAEQNGKKMPPLERFLTLMKPETGDIWILTIVALVTGILAMATPLAVETLVMTVAFGRYLQPVLILATMLFVFLAFKAALTGMQILVAEIIQRRLFARVAADLAYRLPHVQTEALDSKSGRELVNRFFDIVTFQKVTAEIVIDVLTLVITTVVGMIVLAFYHPWLLGFDVVLVGLMAILIFVLGRGAVAAKIKESSMKFKTGAWLEDLAGCGTAFHYEGAAEFALERCDAVVAEYLTARRRYFRIWMRQFIFALAVQVIAGTALLGLGGWLVITGQLTLGQLVAAELIVAMVVGAFTKLGKHISSFYDLMAAMDKLGILFDLPIEHEDGMLNPPSTRPATVSVHAVAYSFPKGRRAVDGITFDVQSGQRWAVTGPTGSGKSVLLDLLFGLRTPTFGHITINGVDPRDLRPDVLRKMVSLVRDVEVFQGTVAENVHLERPDISTSDVRDVLELIGLLPFILKLPDGLDTELCPTGAPLSQNQKKKLMLARAIVGRPNLMLIDTLLDDFPDAEADHLLDVLSDPSAPWSLIIVTGREKLIESLPCRLTLTHTGGVQSVEIDDPEADHVHRSS